MKDKTNVTTPPKQEEKELYVQLIDINSSPRLNENKSTREESLNNTTHSIPSPVSEKEEKIFNKAQDFPDLYSRTNSAAKGLRSSPATYSNKSHSSPKESPRASSSNIVVEITTEEKWNPSTGAWSSNRRPRQKQSNNDVNNPTNDQQVNAGAEDEKVQCPICQRSFSKSKVETHASMCFQFPMETRSNNQETLTSSRDAPADLNNSVDLTESDDENHWETVRAKANKRKGN
ncbi:uncharacterized protein LOC120351190 isoform X2 [Nilaparvata lugens]|uniref:uncharacterized protein LOC120351190 isoform X2 n=1 Tax=Nilaparvata lugens TaxID=108931 RepID=UPI00193C9C08|nr:uncharacterized protein LOC120351190 isoform X2 [Nilaparvata lugens]